MPTETLLSLKQLAESYLLRTMSDEEYNVAQKKAKIKLARIIEREENANNVKLTSRYLAQLIAEEVNSELFYNYCMMMKDLKTLEKKEMPATKVARQI